MGGADRRARRRRRRDPYRPAKRRDRRRADPDRGQPAWHGLRGRKPLGDELRDRHRHGLLAGRRDRLKRLRVDDRRRTPPGEDRGDVLRCPGLGLEDRLLRARALGSRPCRERACPRSASSLEQGDDIPVALLDREVEWARAIVGHRGPLGARLQQTPAEDEIAGRRALVERRPAARLGGVRIGPRSSRSSATSVRPPAAAL